MVCATGSFSAAADRLHLTQPAVSAQIRQIERETGVQLVERIGKRAKATPEGEILIASAERIFQVLDSALERIAQMQGEISGPLRIGAGATATAHLLPVALAELQNRHPKVRLRISTGNTPDLLPGLRDASLDIAILTAPVSDPYLSTVPFYDDRLVCIAPARQVRGIDRLRPSDLRDRRLVLYEPGGFIRQAIDDWLGAAGADAREILDVGSAEAQASFVRAGFGWSIISEMAAGAEAARGGLRAVPLEPALSRQLVLVWRRDRARRPAIAIAIDLLSDRGRVLGRAGH